MDLILDTAEDICQHLFGNLYEFEKCIMHVHLKKAKIAFYIEILFLSPQ